MAVTRGGYAGLFCVAMATLMYEILLSRVFSVTMWYHFAFMAISVAMFGMTVGAIVVYLLPRVFTVYRAPYFLTVSAYLFAVSLVVCFFLHLRLPFYSGWTIQSFFWLGMTYTVIALPFVFSGICICLALTKFPDRVSTLYAADLAGAALGCVALIWLLEVTDGLTAVVFVAALVCAGAVAFGSRGGMPVAQGLAAVTCVALSAFAVYHTIRVNDQRPLLKLTWVKGEREAPALFETWNSFSRIRVWGNPERESIAFGWGVSDQFEPKHPVYDLALDIDAGAGTALTKYTGRPEEIEHLKYDIVNLAHYLRSGGDVLAIGMGGGRDALSALAFDQASVTAVEINEDIIRAVTEVFGDFTGGLDRHPKVRIVNDEARSFLARQQERYDIIIVSLIDTWAATAAGAFVLTENALYTTEAWDLFLRRLTPDGIVTFSRWYSEANPGEVYRLTTLAVAALETIGVEEPRNHILIAKTRRDPGPGPDGVGTILVSPSPFSDEDVARFESVVESMNFELLLSPRYAADETFAMLASGDDLTEFLAAYPIDITAPTDDTPFFFNMLRLRDMFDRDKYRQGHLTMNLRAVGVLGALLIVVIVLSAVCIGGPLALTAHRIDFSGAMPLFLFFAGIGLGFMLVEISQMQRLIIFLGHPVYSLSVVLFTLLLGTGAGSYLTRYIGPPRVFAAGGVLLLSLVLALCAFGAVTPFVVDVFAGSVTPVRISVAVAILFPLGLLMGTAFPLGIMTAADRAGVLTPFLWGINGATSVVASVLSMAIALAFSISTAFWAGVACYVLALTAFVWAHRRGGVT